MSVNPEWDRWIKASIDKYFLDTFDGVLVVHIEGLRKNVADKSEYIELRVDGPLYTEMSKDDYSIYIEINILVHCAMGKGDYHRIREMTGLVAAAMSQTIPLFKYGGDGSAFGCISPVQSKRNRERVMVSHFGEIKPSSGEQQATVEAHYEMKLQV